MRNETLKNLLLTASLISASAFLTACGNDAEPAKTAKPGVSDATNEKLQAAQAELAAAVEKAAALEASINSMTAQQRVAAEEALAAKRKEDKERSKAEQEIIERKIRSLRQDFTADLDAVKSDAFATGQEHGQAALIFGLTTGVDSFTEDMNALHENLSRFNENHAKAHDDLLLLKEYTLPAVKSLAAFEEQVETRAAKFKAVLEESSAQDTNLEDKIAEFESASRAKVDEFDEFIMSQKRAFGVAAPLFLPTVRGIYTTLKTSSEEIVRNYSLAAESYIDKKKSPLRQLDYEVSDRKAKKDDLTARLQNVELWRESIQRSVKNSSLFPMYEMTPMTNFTREFKTFFDSHSADLKAGAMSSDAFVEDFLTGKVAESYTVQVRLNWKHQLSAAQKNSGRVTEEKNTRGEITAYSLSKMTLTELKIFLETAANFDAIKSKLKESIVQGLNEQFPHFFSNTAEDAFQRDADALNAMIPVPAVVLALSSGSLTTAARLSSGVLGNLSGKLSFNQARNAVTGLVDARAFNMNGVSGQSIDLGMPLFVQLKGDVSSAKSTEAATGSVAYRLGNTVIGAIQGYANSGAGFGVDSRQLETSVVASHSFGSFFVEGQIGSVSATDVHISDWSGYRSQITVGLDTEFVSPFVQVSHRQLDRSGFDLNETTGYVGLDMDIAKLAADTYSIDTRLLAKAGYGSKAWSLGSKDLGSTTGFSGSVEWSASLNLNSGVSFGSNFSLDTLAGSSAAVNVSLDR